MLSSHRAAALFLALVSVSCSMMESLSLILNNPSSTTDVSRRRIFISTASAATTSLLLPPTNASALFGLGNENVNRRQLELCLVSLLRFKYWAQTVAERLQPASSTPDARKAAYLEARLGAKAIVANKIGGGASNRVLILSSLKIKESLIDLQYYAPNRRQMEQLRTDLIESLASVVEFDGLETTQDPSPRSSLTMSMYNDGKATFVQRMLSEQTIPLTDSVVRVFSAATRAQCEEYIRKYYSSEIPQPQKPLEETISKV